MPANPYPAKWSSEDVLKAVEQLPPREVEQLYQRLGTMRSNRRSSGLSDGEAALLAKINRGFSQTWWDRYHRLVDKLRQETLTQDEHGVLLRLTDQLEKREAKRLETLVQLAKLRGRSLRALLKDLGLPTKSHA